MVLKKLITSLPMLVFSPIFKRQQNQTGNKLAKLKRWKIHLKITPVEKGINRHYLN